MTDLVVAATVTYGDRSEACLAVARRALECGADVCVIVDNGSVDRSRDLLVQAAAEEERFHLVRSPRNEGSAAGFSTAIASALTVGDDGWLWLLDDDTLPRPEALRHALVAADEAGPDSAIACLRTSDPLQVAVVEGAPVSSTLALPGSFLGFDLVNRLRPTRPAGRATGPIEIPWAPYGGLLVRCEAARAIEPPHREFVLYGDDRDWCARLRRAGTRLLLEPSAAIDDIVDRWATGSSEPTGGVLERMIRSGDRRRAYYLIRNTAFEDIRSVKGARQTARLIGNIAVYAAATLATAIRVGRPEFVPLFGRALVQGARGRWYPRSGS